MPAANWRVILFGLFNEKKYRPTFVGARVAWQTQGVVATWWYLFLHKIVVYIMQLNVNNLKYINNLKDIIFTYAHITYTVIAFK